MSSNGWGVILALIASAEWGVGSIFARLGMRHISSTTATFLSLLAGFSVTVAVALIMDASAFLALSLGTVLAFAFLGFLQFGVGRFMGYTSISLIGVGRATAIGGSAPIFSSVLAILFLGEKLSLPLALGTVAVVVGIALIATEGQKKSNG